MSVVDESALIGERVCSDCKQTKTLDEMYRRTRAANPSGRCKPCARERRAREYREKGGIDQARKQNLARYGLTLRDYERMVAEQDGLCAICKRAERRMMHGKVAALSVDHDHRTGVVRQLLCSTCNFVIGHLENNPVDPHLLVAYLDRHGSDGASPSESA